LMTASILSASETADAFDDSLDSLGL